MKCIYCSAFVQGIPLSNGKPSFLSKKKYLQEDMKIFGPIPTFVNCPAYCPPLYLQLDKINKQWSYNLCKSEQRVFFSASRITWSPVVHPVTTIITVEVKTVLTQFFPTSNVSGRTWLITLGSIFTVTGNACFSLFNALSFYFQGLWSRIAFFCQTWRSINR